MTEQANQPIKGSDNALMLQLGEMWYKAAGFQPQGGDYIDNGLILLRMLNENGFDLVKRDVSNYLTAYR